LKIFKRHKSDPKAVLKDLLEDYELPSFPTGVMNVLSLLRDSDSNMGEVAELIKVDPGLNVSVLRMVNSAAFGFASKVSNILHAITLLGRAGLEPIVLSHAVRDSIPLPCVRGFAPEEFWKASTRRACLARLLAHHLHPETETEAFTAGLLQDMAVPVLVEKKKQAYCKVLQAYNEDDSKSLDELEMEAFGFDHQVIGSLMAEQWELPEYLQKSIAGHHGCGESDVDAAIFLVSYMREYGEAGDNEALFSIAASEFGIERNKMLGHLEDAYNDADELTSLS